MSAIPSPEPVAESAAAPSAPVRVALLNIRYELAGGRVVFRDEPRRVEIVADCHGETCVLCRVEGETEPRPIHRSRVT